MTQIDVNNKLKDEKDEKGKQKYKGLKTRFISSNKTERPNLQRGDLHRCQIIREESKTKLKFKLPGGEDVEATNLKYFKLVAYGPSFDVAFAMLEKNGEWQ